MIGGAVVMYAIAALSLAFVPTDDPIRSGRWIAPVGLLILFGIGEVMVFNVTFRRESISFALSEVPTALALVYLSPLGALLARIPLALLVLVLVRRNSGIKLATNIGIYALEISLGAYVFRWAIEFLGRSDSAILIALLAVWVVVTPLNSAFLTWAISRVDGQWLSRLKSSLLSSWWVSAFSTTFSVMTVSVALHDARLLALVAAPAAGLWWALTSAGRFGQELRDLESTFGFVGSVGTSLDPAGIADAAVGEIVHLFRTDDVQLVRFVAAECIVHRHGTCRIDLPESARDPRWTKLLAGPSRLLGAADIEERHLALPGRQLPTIFAPVIDRGETLGVLIVTQNDESVALRFEDADAVRLGAIAQQLAVSLRRGMLHEQIEYEARHDALTGLPGRTVFEHATADAAADADRRYWVIMLDLDRFKEVNDTLGHHAGDELLVQFSQRMRGFVHADDLLVRLAGDEFALLCPRESESEIFEFAEMIVGEGNKPWSLGDLEVVVTVSAGIAEVTSTDDDGQQPLRRADVAMYHAKSRRSGTEFYRPETDRRTAARLSMLGDLRAAIEAGALDIHYQPKLALASGRIIGVEALARWNDPVRGPVPPQQFIRVAEESGLITRITDFVLSSSLTMIRRLRDAGFPISLAVNLSTHDLFDSRLPERARGYLDALGLPTSALMLEITESALFVDVLQTRTTIDRFRQVDLALAVDDFGTGYSSLSLLRRLPVAELKIDQSFVSAMLTDPQAEVIVRSTIDLGHNLGLKVIAEGVESDIVLERLRWFGCDAAQGYSISKPLAEAELLAFMTDLDQSRGAVGSSWIRPAGGPSGTPTTSR